MEKNISKDNYALAIRIVRTANMSDRPAYYSGRGALLGDFNFGKPSLNIIFEELRKINEEFALNFVDFVMSFKNLNATDFLTYFYSFARNNFTLQNKELRKNGVNLDADNEEQRNLIALATVFSGLGNTYDETEAIKNKFLRKLPEDIQNLEKIKAYMRSEGNFSRKRIADYY